MDSSEKVQIGAVELPSLDKFRVQVLSAHALHDGGLMHLVREGDDATLCRAYRISTLLNPQHFEAEVCPACLEHLRADWLAAPKTNGANPAG
jgi:hypothetical protein